MHHVSRGLAALAAGVLAVAGGSGLASAHSVSPNLPSVIGGYVWANNPTAASYAPSSPFSWNSAGQANHIDRTGTGAYKVTFGGVGSTGGTAQVSTYGSTVADCAITKWAASGADEQVKVHCFKPGGTTPVDAQFDTYFATPAGPANYLAFALANRPTAANYTPALRYQYDNHGGTITVARTNVGTYSVVVPNMTDYPTSVEISAYGPGTNRCAVIDWGDPNNIGSQIIDVQCVTANNHPKDAKFVVSMQSEQNLLGDNSAYTAAAWADEPSASGTYVPSTAYQWNLGRSGFGSNLTATRLSRGRYLVAIPGAGGITDGGHAEVTVYASTRGRCQVDHWSWDSDPTVEDVYVRCTAVSGTPADHLFTLQFTGQM